MADLGAMMTAERIARFADQLDELKRRLKELTVKHINDIERDAIVRAKFRQLAESLGVDFGSLVRGAAQSAGKSSSHSFAELVTSMMPGGAGGDRQQQLYRLACETIQGCIHERQYVGTYVPMNNIVGFLRRKYKSHGLHFDSLSSSHNHRSSSGDGCSIGQEDVVAALKTIAVLGSGYACVDIDGALYIQSVAGATSTSVDALAVLSHASKLHRLRAAEGGGSTSMTTTEGGAPKGSARIGHLVGLPSSTTRTSRVSLARHSGAPPVNDDATTVSQQHHDVNDNDDGSGGYCYSWDQMRRGFPAWPLHRLDAALNALMHDGAVWLDCPQAVVPSNAASSSHATSLFWFVHFLLADRSIAP